MKRALVAALTAALACFSSSAADAQTAPQQPLSFSVSPAAPLGPIFPLGQGLSTCSVVVQNATNASLIPQAESDPINSASTSTWATATNVSGGAITTFGLYTGNVSATGLTGFRVILNPTSSGSASGTYVCTAANIPGSGGGGGSSGSVTAAGTNGTLAQAVQGITGGVPVAVTGTFSSTTTFPYNAAQSQAAQTASVLGVAGEYFAAAPTLTNTQVNPLSLDAGGRLIISPQGLPTPLGTQPVSGTVTANQGTSPWQDQLVASAATIGSIGNTAFGITSAGTAGGGVQTATSIPAIAAGCVYNAAAPAPTSGQFVPLQCSSNGGLLLAGTFTTSFPYSLVTQGQTPLASSGVGVLGVYNSSAPTLTTGQAAPLQVDASGNLNVNLKAGGNPVGAGAFAPAQSTLTTTASQVVAARTGASGTGRVSFTLYNTSAVTLYLGNTGVTSTTGVILPAGASITLATTAAIYGVAASGSQTVSYYELY